MSWRSSALVWERTRAKGSNLLMMLAIADYSHDDGRGAFASPRTLTSKSRLSVRGGEIVLTKLVEDGELRPKWEAGEARLWWEIRCITEWTAYRQEGRLPMEQSAKIARKQSAKFALKLVALATAKAQTLPARAQTLPTRAQTAAISLCSGSVIDPSVIQEQGAAPHFLPHQPVEKSADSRVASVQSERSPEENIRVITKIVHEVLDNFADADDVTEGDVVEAVKRHCAVLEIAYDSAVVWSALESAVVQRRRIGKPSLRGTG